MYQTLLVPLDGSPRAEMILPHVWDLAMQFQSKVIFLMVVESPLQFVNPSLYENHIPADVINEYLVNYSSENRRNHGLSGRFSGCFSKKGN